MSDAANPAAMAETSPLRHENAWTYKTNIACEAQFIWANFRARAK